MNFRSALSFAAFVFATACTRAAPADVVATVDPNIATVLHVTWRTEEATTGRVDFGADDAYGMSTSVEAAATTDHSVTLFGNHADSTVHFRVVSVSDEGDDVLGEDQTATTDPLPSGIPEMTEVTPITNENIGPWLLTTYLPVDEDTSHIVILDPTGATVWYWYIGTGIMESVRVTRDGTGVQGVARPGEDLFLSEIIRISFEGVETRIPVAGAHHDLVELPEGGWATIVRQEREVPDLGNVAGDSLVEVTPEGDTTVIWNAFEQMDVVVNGGWDFSQIPGAADWTHGNGIAYDQAEGSYYLSMYYTENVVKIDRATGATRWILGGVEEQFTLEGDAVFGPQHSPELFDGGIRLFDNGHSFSAGSRLVEYTLDETAMSASLTWSWVPDPIAHTLVLGDMTRFDDGSAMASWGISGDIYAIDAQGQTAGRLDGPVPETVGQLTILPTFYP